MGLLVLLAVLAGLALGLFAGVRLSRGRARRRAQARFRQWQAEQLLDDQELATKRSRAILRGQVVEQLAPLFEDFRYHPSDARFLGKPVDFLIFDGYDDVRAGRATELREIVFLDIKTGNATLSTVERRIKDCIDAGAVSTWRPWADRAGTPGPTARSITTGTRKRR